MSDFSKRLKTLVKEFDKYGFYEFSYKEKNFEIYLRKNGKRYVDTYNVKETNVEPLKQETDIPKTHEEKTFYIESDRVGKFFSLYPPDSDKRLKKGDFIKKGDKLGYIVSMDVVYDIKSNSDGIVKDILISDGEMVEYGQALFEILKKEV
jgi:acetyl-CoA carboxylase biotin carboxyl carrier protein